ncbi:DUF1449 domain-containing protein [Leptolyngbya sp. AN02str]|uniref:DUF1449 domain-containing protein n=1 Tax=Leptolyngbya sp. AN02str TaxID=3423363 RepID=UPI003D3193B9
MAILDPANLPYWLLLGMGVLLFLVIIVFGGDDDDLDIDDDFDFDTDGDSSGLNIGSLMGWLGVGKAPLVLLLAIDLSLWGLLGWMTNVFLLSLLGPILGGLVSSVMLFSSLLIALFLGSQIARPIGQLFASFGEDTSSDRLIGCIGNVSTSTIPYLAANKIGQVDVLDPARNLITVNAALPNWATTPPKRGEQVLIIERIGSSYLVITKDSPDQTQWLSQSSTKPNNTNL